MTHEVYRLPLYYDIAFTWDVGPEIEFFGRLFEKYVPHPVKHVLEPACGTGRFLIRFPGFGYRITGYDLSADMAAYARDRIKQKGVDDRASVFVGDMRFARFRQPFDAAFNSINSIGYLLSDREIASHLRVMGDSLKPGAVYIVHLGCSSEVMDGVDPEPWTHERDGVQVTTTWGVEREDPETKLSYQYCRMEVCRRDENLEFKDSHTMRLWKFDDWLGCITGSGRFMLEAVYDERYEEIRPGTTITGEMGNLYYVLKST